MLLLLLLAVLVVRASHARPQQAEGRDLVLEAMVMRTHNHRLPRHFISLCDEFTSLYSTRRTDARPLVGGGILERKIIVASNGTQRSHQESREMECCKVGNIM